MGIIGSFWGALTGMIGNRWLLFWTDRGDTKDNAEEKLIEEGKGGSAKIK
jgi:hypothetical protein